MDDFATVRLVARGPLKTLGVEKISQASNGREALHLMQSEPFDLVLSDWNMPVLNGLESLISTLPLRRRIPFV